ncbi:hypothetical protein SAMN00017405_2318 [Desulfonispora thiosulfatigenes DSM 11270]|uniref:Uncharacterized protein n=1 Tax=Desulfonispora thiosulfatigenes DSM 11270 TaxID=656914 RepID=A0A1W1VT65_DESTI|nr:hypothetical protein SAMN00017405_2318 [Desulfonispora thiosulfatigenes DSM 11270]
MTKYGDLLCNTKINNLNKLMEEFNAKEKSL